MEIEYSVKYSPRKTISIIVERDRSVVVRAPLNTNPEVIQKEISKRKFLLFQKINHIEQLIQATNMSCSVGNLALVSPYLPSSSPNNPTI